MITSFEIKKFRLFDHLKVDRLSRVNLIVGKNNSGKSALLEALMLYHSKFSIHVIINILKHRMEDLDSKLSIKGTALSDSMRHFFRNHILPEIGESLLLSSGNGALVLESAAYVFQNIEKSDGRLVRKRMFISKNDDIDDKHEICLLVKEDGDPVNTIDLDGRIPSPLRLRRIADEESARFVSPRGINDEQAAQMWDLVQLSNMDKMVLDGLKLIEPSIEKLAFIKSSERPSDRIPVARLNCFDVPVPLKSLGDGMTRILHIILSLVSCSKGAVLAIDEFENGLHWSVQPKVWKMIFELAKKLDVQVFTSTHSRDCVAGFLEAWEGNESDGAFLRLMRGEGQPPVQEYDLELLRSSLESTIEVR